MRLPNGYGGVFKLSGRRRRPYAAFITTGWTEEGKQERKYIGYYTTKKDALKALADYHERPFDLAKKNITFAELYDAWGKFKYKGEPVPAKYATAFANAKPLHNEEFLSLRKRHLQQVIDTCPLGYFSLSNIKTLFNQLYKYAIDQEIVTTNYSQLIDMPKATQSEIHQPFTPDEIEALWHDKENELSRIALLLIYTGLRPSELMKMKVEDIHLDERYMRGGSKTDAGKNRVIPIAKKILPLLKTQLESAGESLIPWTYPKLLHCWNKNELLKNHLPHDGRHTCASLLDNAGVNLKIRQLILGHSSGDITNKVYTHKTISQLIDAIDTI